jgi:hypothetical protein
MSKRSKLKHETSESDVYSEIVSVEDIPIQTSKWNEEHRKAMMIEFIDADQAGDLVELVNDYPETWGIFSEWDRIKFRNVGITDLDNIFDKKLATIASKASRIISKEESKQSVREAEVDSFVMSLLEYVGFDEWPFQTELQHKYTFSVPDPDGKQFSSTVDFLIHVREERAVLIVEDKHLGNVGFLSEWSEPQIAGEILAFAFSNIPQKYPIVVHVIRVVGTRFTFYKACVEKNYMKELSIAGIPRIKANVRLEVLRYPSQSEDTTLNAWDLCNSEDRHNTLLMLYSLKNFYCI